MKMFSIHGGPRIHPSVKAQIRPLYNQGLSCQDVASRLRISIGTVQRQVDATGGQRSPSEAASLAKRRRARMRLIAEAAQKVFGHLRAPASTHPAAAGVLPPVNAGFDDDLTVADFEDVEGWL